VSVILFRNIAITHTLHPSPQRRKKTTVIKWQFTYKNFTFSETLSNENINFTTLEQIKLFQEMINTMKCINEGRITNIKTFKEERS